MDETFLVKFGPNFSFFCQTNVDESNQLLDVSNGNDDDDDDDNLRFNSGHTATELFLIARRCCHSRALVDENSIS